MTKFEREAALATNLLNRLRLETDRPLNDPNTKRETGVDVSVHLRDQITIGIQVTELDPWTTPGTARAQEKATAKGATPGPYFQWAQNDTAIVYETLARAIIHKSTLAERHSPSGYTEVWLLVSTGIADVPASTFVMTPWLSVDDINSTTDEALRGSKYDRCFLLPTHGVEQAFYQWDRVRGWKKSMQLDEIGNVPRQAYVDQLTKTAEAEDWPEVDRLCDEECKSVLNEMRQA